MDIMHRTDATLVQKWEPVLEGIDSEYTRRVTAQLLENQAKSIVEDRLQEALSTGATTTGQLGTFQKFAFPLVRRVFPELIANKIVGVQPMQGPVSQVFYLGSDRVSGDTVQTLYSKYNLTYKGLTAQPVGSNSTAAQDQTTTGGTFVGTDGVAGTGVGLDGDYAANGFDTSNVLNTLSGTSEIVGAGAASGTFGGQAAAWPNPEAIYGFSLSGGERLSGSGIPEMTFHIEQEAVVAQTRKMRALWTLEASQDLKAYHNLDLERELTELLSKELQLEIDRELIEDLRGIAYGLNGVEKGGLNQNLMDASYINMGSFPGQKGAVTGPTIEEFVPAQFNYDFASEIPSTQKVHSNVFVVDLSQSSLTMYPRHVGEVYANLLAIINLASQDIYRSTMRGPGNWLLTSPLVASMLESAAKLEGGIMPKDGPTNIGGASIEYKGKFMGRYDLYVDPMYPTDEIMMGYKGANAMDAGFVYCPYIPLQQLPTITDPETFQPRKGLLTRYGKVQIQPMNRFYRIIKIVGPTSNYLYSPFARNTSTLGGATTV
jgi:hypothetical protein